MIVEYDSFGPAQTNVVFLACEETKKAAVFDAPLDCSSFVKKAAKEYDASPVMLLLTHSHWDHIADAAALKDKWKCTVCVHGADAENVEVPGSDKMPLYFQIQPTKVDHFLKEEEILQLGNLQIEVIHTPGHTPGGVCFYLKKEKLLISGDTLFKGSIGNLSFPTSNPNAMWNSLEKLAKLPPDTRVIPGHGAETTIGSEYWLKDAKQIFGG